MSSIDDLLNQLKAERQEQTTNHQPPPAVPNPPPEATEDLLENLKAQFARPSNPSPAKAEAGLEELKQRYQQQKAPPSTYVEEDLHQVRLKAMEIRAQREAHQAAARKPEDLLQQLRHNYAQNRELQRQQQEAARQAEQRRKQQREALKPTAREWLKKLDPLSDEGFWFEQFAQGYGDRLEAALDYLQALQSS